MSTLSFKTPDYSHVVQQYDDVYEPSEDTFLMLDALENDCEFLRKIRPTICVEVGCGSGLVITFLSSILGTNAFYIATDVNPRAVLCTQQTAQRNGSFVDVINTSLVEACRLFHQVDVLIFNPPYVVTSSKEVTNNGITATWAGGEHGREVMDKLFPLVPNILSDQGVFYLLTEKENNPDEIKQIMTSYGMQTKTILRRKARNEKLSILKIQKNDVC